MLGLSETFPEHFGPNNIPFGVASSPTHRQPTCATRINDTVIFLAPLARSGMFDNIAGNLEEVFSKPALNDFAALPKSISRSVRAALQSIISMAASTEELLARLPKESAAPISEVQLHLPVAVGDFTDYSASENHMLNMSEIISGRRATPPSFYNFPVGYGGRAGSIVVSGTPIERPYGQYAPRDQNTGAAAGGGNAARLMFNPSQKVDYELEVAAVIGRRLSRGERLHAADADKHIFGLVLLNDWSARDIQAHEMTGLGPNNGKSFGTSISPWIITLEALEPFKMALDSPQRTVPSYLDDPHSCTYTVDLTVEILHGSDHASSTTVCTTALQTLYWTFRHILAHQAVGGSGLRTGDVVACGTVSGAADSQRGCLMEATRGGKQPLTLTDGSTRVYLEDGDVVRLTGAASSTKGVAGVGFGECIGQLCPARPWP
ncbi:fumarylacetoacetate hydrolase family protein [Eremomyces bilateralis CBS 781.70]|uniref:Fumarylacetoacetase n=1 Tax=Eremomyces bilateralis CBS 781.70 TaxID=1392243 RepID=A0A6G1GEG0_9PEZI|nr:fumarylacetoacetate hydrolase family protein [Eremomyces bilateralis CBS 781.70]KAF1816412.1 fumarylacetoacetate hydrolase family protein [Eremomyces bilateralis CBS 781.70]